ncbi:GntR family transcriptional regulator [Actinomadura latina]|uniref:GntR family transcriptional regulator n=1 Tax=Actinomadura latina TaxID=163603 RepID=A0A846YTZ3_9ACTN|nr:GntR family transcriptional regulator [Actinomadura latina]NKZ04350.1 GntR family transcriptional regulator [Actinomadura latina]
MTRASGAAYRRIAEVLRARIAEGTYPAGGRLPGEHELSREFAVARDTVRHALRVLQDEGLFRVVTGLGRFVLPVPADNVGPTYERIAADLRALIENGSLPVGSLLPSESRICERYGVARFTVRRALEQLEAAGLVECVHGRGRFVLPRRP